MAETSQEKISSFTQLETWQKGHELVLEIYRITRQFPSTEQFSLTSQLRRSAVSITSNIAEGFSRKTNKDKRNFYYTSLGSVTELQNQLLVAKDLDYISGQRFRALADNTVVIAKLLNGLIKSTR